MPTWISSGLATRRPTTSAAVIRIAPISAEYGTTQR